MKRLLLALLLAALPVVAQEQKKEEPRSAPAPTARKLFVLKYADPQQLFSLISGLGGSPQTNQELHAITVAAPEPNMPGIEDAIRRLDVPQSSPQNIELTVYLLAGEDGSGGAGPDLPKDLAGVVTQLKNAFSYKSYRLWDVLTMRTRTGKEVTASSNGGAVQVGAAMMPVSTQFRFSSVSTSADGTIHIAGLRSSNRVPVPTSGQSTAPIVGSGALLNTQFSYAEVGLNTDIDIKDGQKVVVGKQSAGPNQALFLILTAHVAQ
jgi:hypothetical protein